MYMLYIYIYIYYTCDVRLAGCVALFSTFYLLLLIYHLVLPLYLYLYLSSPNFLSIISLFVTRWMQMETVIFARFARFVLLLFLSLVVRTAELDGGCMRLSRDHM